MFLHEVFIIVISGKSVQSAHSILFVFIPLNKFLLPPRSFPVRIATIQSLPVCAPQIIHPDPAPATGQMMHRATESAVIHFRPPRPDEVNALEPQQPELRPAEPSRAQRTPPTRFHNLPTGRATHQRFTLLGASLAEQRRASTRRATPASSLPLSQTQPSAVTR